MHIDLTTVPDPADLAALEAGMWRYTVSVLPDLPDESADVPVAAFVRDGDGAVVGGIKAAVYWNGVEVEVLWVDAAYRRRGIASALLGRVEDFGRAHGAVVAFLKTVGARAFYERLGYQVYGVLEDRPIGTLLYHMKKRLDR